MTTCACAFLAEYDSGLYKSLIPELSGGDDKNAENADKDDLDGQISRYIDSYTDYAKRVLKEQGQNTNDFRKIGRIQDMLYMSRKTDLPPEEIKYMSLDDYQNRMYPLPNVRHYRSL